MLKKRSQASNQLLGASRADLLCRNGCGFFGNPEWQWYCSKCWREHQQRVFEAASHDASPARVKKAAKSPGRKDRESRVQKQEHPFGSSADQKNFRQLFKKQSQAKDRKDLEAPPEAKLIGNEFSAFLSERLDRNGVVEVSRQLKVLVERIQTAVRQAEDAVEVSNTVQELYQSLYRHLNSFQTFKGLSDEDRDAILDWCERYTLVFCHKELFCPAGISNDEEKDLELQNRIRRLNWIATKHLGCDINQSSQEVRDILHQAMTYILEMDGRLSPQDKLLSLIACCKSIFEMLKVSNQAPASADEFLPCLIYVILKSNPPRMHSNVNFISRFRNEEKLRMGEAGYFFANLCCALSFIENMTGESINIDPEEFDSYVSGRTAPPGSWQSSLLMCSSLQAMAQDVKALKDLKARQERVTIGALELKDAIANFEKEITNEVELMLERTRYEIRGPKVPASMDSDSPPPVELPSPILPSVNAVMPPPKKESEAQDVDEEAKMTKPVVEGAQSKSSVEYHGFSAQCSSIPSIPCQNELVEPREQPNIAGSR